MKALVTGASGFIGSSLIEELIRQGFEVKALMRRTSNPENLQGLAFDRVEGDLGNVESIRQALADVDYVFHLAGSVFSKNRAEYFEQNAEGTRRVAQAIAEVRPGLKRMVYVSSQSAGGPMAQQESRTEEMTDRPVSDYGASKVEAERLLKAYHGTFPIVILRPPMVYGPKDKATFLFVQTVARGLMPLFGPRPKYYSMIHVHDLCRGLVHAALAPLDRVPSGEMFYMTGDGDLSYEQLMGAIAQALGKRPFKLRLPMGLLTVGARALAVLGKVTGQVYSLNPDKVNEMLPDYWLVSNAKAKRQLGFAPQYTPVAGWAQTVEWYKQKRWI